MLSILVVKCSVHVTSYVKVTSYLLFFPFEIIFGEDNISNSTICAHKSVSATNQQIQNSCF